MEPEAEFDRQIHARLLAGDPTASEEFARYYLPLVVRHVAIRARAHGVNDPALVNDATVDAVFDLIRHPDKFDPQRSGLLGYLKRAAERDLINAVQKDRRRRRGEELHADVELAILNGNKQEDVHVVRREVEERAIARIQRERDLACQRGQVAGGRDQQILQLMTEGERRTSVFAAVLGIADRPAPEQRRLVKQHKDRLKAQMKRGRNRRRV